jgi:signal transduction histidine kinase
MRNILREEEQRRYRFVMGVTHDLKTPLALIKAYTEAIEDDITEDPATHTSATKIISAKVDQFEGMINDLIELACMDSGQWRSQLKKVNIAAFLRTSVKVFSLDTELLCHRFEFNIALPENIFISMDEGLVLRAFGNMVHNAIRYTPDGSVIRLNASLEEKAIRVTVSDNGPGIDQSDILHIFEMFYRGTGSRRDRGWAWALRW